jgi:hypothetical protein
MVAGGSSPNDTWIANGTFAAPSMTRFGIVHNLDDYGQSGADYRALIFCTEDEGPDAE